MKRTYVVSWWQTTISIRADFGEPLCRVEGADNRTVHSFNFSPRLAMAYALHRQAKAEGFSLAYDLLNDILDEMIELDV